MEIRVLGPLEIADGDRAIPLPAAKQRRLLAALLIHVGAAQSADDLIEAVWGSSPPASAAKVLTVYVSQLRKALPERATILAEASGYRLALDPRAIDAVRFERLLAEGRQALRVPNAPLAASILQRALALWRGPAYGEFAYDDFARPEAERLQELRLQALEERTEAQLVLGQHRELLGELLALAAEHPLQERLQAQAMVALYRCGRQAEALDLYADVRRRLGAELGLEPSVELRELQRRILQHAPDLTVGEYRERPRQELPTPPNKLVGRERELAELQTLLLRNEARLLVLAGAGGSGKTRLALEVARNIASFFANGAAFVSLAELRTPDLLLETIARALEIEEVPGEEPSETLARALHERELLLVLDNVEHVRPATRCLPDLLARAPRLTLLVTSRAVLHLSGEQVYPVQPLGDDAAAELFAERAQQSNAAFSADSTAAAIRAICRRLDRLPLAIELAAAGMRALSPQELLDRLDRRLPLLAGGPRDAAARQQTLRATVDWSRDLLSPAEQHTFAALAVFAGGWTTAAAESVCGATLDELVSLLDHNLIVRHDATEGSRFRMLQTLREYALAPLEGSGGLAALRRRHAEWVRGLADSASRELARGEQTRWLDRLAAEHANIRAALEFAVEADDGELALAIVGSLGRYWPIRGHIREGSFWCNAALGLSDPEDYELRIDALYWQSDLASNLGDWTVASSAANEALALASARRDRNELARASFKLACARFADDPESSARLFEEAAAFAADAGADRIRAAIDIDRGRILLLNGNPDGAVELLQSASETFREVEDTQNFAEAQTSLALALLGSGRDKQARRLLDESIAQCAKLRSHIFLALCLETLAAFALRNDEIDRALGLFIRAQALFDAAGGSFGGPLGELYDRLWADVQCRFSGEQIQAARAVNPSAELVEALAFATSAN